jgi:hypothetical protein
MSWADLNGRWEYKAGASGTVTIPKGAAVVELSAHSTAGGATVAIFGHDAIPIAAADRFVMRPGHLLVAPPLTGDDPAVAGFDQIVFTGTDSFFGAWVRTGFR